jgi:hypothetical protein
MATPRGLARRAFRLLIALSRASEWWDHKLSPLAAVGYAAALKTGLAVHTVVGAIALATLAIVLEAVYVSVINDVTDVAADAAAGKHNRAAGRSPAVLAIVIAAVVAAGAALAVASWRSHAALLIVYAGGWASFTLYSVPPARLKRRGAAGALADGLGAHGFPTMVMCLAVFETYGRSIPVAWLTVVAAWAVALGFRGATWHQLSDVASDQAAGTGTFGARAPAFAARVVTTAAFPLECGLLTAWLAMTGNAIPLIGLGLSVAVEVARARWLDTHLIVVRPAPRYNIALHEFYVVVMPAGLLVAAATRHFAIFHRVAAGFAADVAKIASRACSEVRGWSA